MRTSPLKLFPLLLTAAVTRDCHEGGGGHLGVVSQSEMLTPSFQRSVSPPSAVRSTSVITRRSVRHYQSSTDWILIYNLITLSGFLGVNTEEYGAIRDNLADMVCKETSDEDEGKVCCRSDELELTVGRNHPAFYQCRLHSLGFHSGRGGWRCSSGVWLCRWRICRN